MSKKTIEADITIGHHGLSLAESMTVRVALNYFCEDIANNGLGDDEHGKLMTAAYKRNASSVLDKIHACIENKEQPT